jgi:Bacterial Ig domain/Domain of unknown function (DUF5060)/Bacterial Ig-like domain/Putative collagen-binding domain of a collagenase
MNRLLASLTASLAALLTPLSAAVSVSGELKQWHPVTITLDGPASTEAELGVGHNPFRDVRLDVTFTDPDGNTRVVPGYFANDGLGAESTATGGTKWRAHINPDKTGTWSYSISLKKGDKAAINGGGTAVGDNGASGNFTVGVSDKSGLDFRGPNRGQLDYVGGPALRWRGGTQTYFYKIAMNHSEMFLTFKDFDNTTTERANANHVADWNTGDPTWKGGKGKGLIGVVNYLSGQGINEHYFLTMNTRGDGKQTFPWTSSEAKWNYDVSKLAQWGVVFDHMMKKGLLAQFVLDECENQMLFEWLDGTPSGGMADSRKLYYREMAARFGYLNALIWNIGEENGWGKSTPEGATTNTAQRKSRAAWLRGLLTPQAHIVVHNGPAGNDNIFTGILGDTNYSGISFQGNLSDTGHGNGSMTDWRTQSQNASRPWVIAYDEPFIGGIPAVATFRKNALWASLTGGATGVGLYSSQDGSLQDYRTNSFPSIYADMKRAHDFLFANSVPFWDMAANNGLVGSGIWCLAKAGNTYVVYLPNGGTTNLNLSGQTGNYDVRWYDPRNGGALQNGSVTSVTGGGSRALGNAPSSTTSDWVILVKLSGGPANVAPTVAISSPANNAPFTAPANITINATASDSDGTVTKVEFFQGTTLLGSDNTSPYSYTWNAVAVGNYTLTAKATDNSGDVTTSTAVAITVTAPTANVPPTVAISSPANNAPFTTPTNITINATASDSDGTVTKVEFFQGTTLLGSDNTSPYSYTWNTVAAGNYTLTAKATDNSGDVTTSAVIAISVSPPSGNVAPTVAITSPANNATFTTPTNITINATASDSDGTVTKVEFFQGTTLLGSDNTSPYSYTWNTVAAGNYSLTAKATDNSGAVTDSAAIAVMVNIPAPSQPAPPTLSGDGTATPTLQGTTEPGATVHIMNGSTQIGTVVADGSGNWTYQITTLGAGTHSITTYSENSGGNSPSSTAITVTVGSGGSSGGDGSSGKSSSCGLGGLSALAGMLLMGLLVMSLRTTTASRNNYEQ